MKIFTKVDELREELRRVRQSGASIGLTPTMGALHEGHASLMRAARAENDYVVASIFVNPIQFAPTEDLASYPRSFEADCRLAEEIGIQAVFAPDPDEMYPEGDSTRVEVTGHLTAILCGRSRPDHFRGVTTVVAKLLNIVAPDRAYFGQKDGQQAQVVRRMARDLFIPAEIRIMPIIRENDGLALSSRNAYLDKEERAAALVLSRSLEKAKGLIEDGGCRRRDEVLAALREMIEGVPGAGLDYAELYSFPDLGDLDELHGQVFIALAVKFCGARLIDNIVVTV